MDHSIICKKWESIMNFPPNPIFGNLSIVEKYFKSINGYRGTYTIAMKTHIVRKFVLKGYKRSAIQKALNIHHSTLIYHLDRHLMPYEEKFLEDEFEKCLIYSLVPVTVVVSNNHPSYKLTPVHQLNKN